MSKCIIEGNMDFQKELYKMLDEESEDDDDNVCLITGEPLKDNFVTLNCKHHFNYDALFKEIYKQKYELNTYKTIYLNDQEYSRYIKSGQDFFIKCPYCRNVQFSILPYYEELGFQQYYGINSLDNTLPIPQIYFDNENNYIGDPNYTFFEFQKKFSLGTCLKVINEFGDKCKNKFVTNIQNTNNTFCRFHYKEECKKYKLKEKMALIQANEEKKKRLETINAERVKNGLKPLKHCPTNKNKNKNKNNNDKNNDACVAILKTGPNAGNPCGCKKIEQNQLCKRHKCGNILIK
jgi:hypothetical protein